MSDMRHCSTCHRSRWAVLHQARCYCLHAAAAAADDDDDDDDDDRRRSTVESRTLRADTPHWVMRSCKRDVDDQLRQRSLRLQCRRRRQHTALYSTDTHRHTDTRACSFSNLLQTDSWACYLLSECSTHYNNKKLSYPQRKRAYNMAIWQMAFHYETV